MTVAYAPTQGDFDINNPGHVANPDPFLRRLRHEQPVFRSDALRASVITRYPDVKWAAVVAGPVLLVRRIDRHHTHPHSAGDARSTRRSRPLPRKHRHTGAHVGPSDDRQVVQRGP